MTRSSNTGPGLKTMIDAHEASNSIGMELIDCIELPVLVVDRDLTLVSFNPAAAKLLALTRLGLWQTVAVDSNVRWS